MATTSEKWKVIKLPAPPPPPSAVQRLLGAHPSLAPELERLAAVEMPVAGPPEPSAEQLLLVPPDPAEGRKPRPSRRARRR